MGGDDHREAYTAIVWGGLLSRERHNIAEAEAVDSAEGNMCGSAIARNRRSAVVEDPITPKGNASELGRPHLVRRGSCVGGLRREPYGARRRGTGEESDALHSSDEAPEQSRDGPGRQGVGGGGGRGAKEARSEEERIATHVPGSEPDEACHQSGSRTGRGSGDIKTHSRSRQTFGRSPVRESRSPGSVRGAVSNHRPYRDPK